MKTWSLVQGVANRDIKLENTLLDGTTRPLIKICDFGYSKVCSMRCPLHTASDRDSLHAGSCSPDIEHRGITS